jgi:plastocyanin
MKKQFFFSGLIILILSFTIQLFSQSSHEVSVTDFSFTPSTLTIAVGDIVKWTNNQGTHNVDGSKAKYPSNPESFGNDGGVAGWTYSFTFTMAGTYDYQCSFHGISMSGKINVGSATNLQNHTAEKPSVKVFPNPSDGILFFDMKNIKHEKSSYLTLKIYDTRGSLLEVLTIPKDETHSVNIGSLNPAIYNYSLADDLKVIDAGQFIKK